MPDTPTAEDTALAFLKTALGRNAVDTKTEAYLSATLDRARGELQRAGLSLDEGNPADCALLAATAEWIYKRRNAEDPKPRSLRDEIHSRQVSRTTGGAT